MPNYVLKHIRIAGSPLKMTLLRNTQEKPSIAITPFWLAYFVYIIAQTAHCHNISIQFRHFSIKHRTNKI